MIAFPLIIFSVWFLIEFKRTGLNGYTYILLLYVISSVCSVLIDVNNYYTWSCPKKPIGFFAPLLYVILLLLCIYPFKNIAKLQIKKISERSENLLVRICIIYVIVFLIVLFTSYNRIQVVIFSENLANIRNEQYTGDAVSFYDHLSGLPRIICAICSIISPSSFFMVFVFGYMMAFSDKTFLIKLLPLIGSLTPLLISINIADRSQYFYWIALMGFTISIFYKFFTPKVKIYTFAILLSLLSIILAYFIIVSISRFEMRDGGTEGGIILYAGMSYLNFCTFINYVDPPLFDLSIIFPTINRYILNGKGYFYLASVVEAQNHIPISTFPTFLGIIYSVCGVIVLFFYVLIFHFVSNKTFYRYKRKQCNFRGLTIMWVLAIVTTLGVIGYFYMNSNATIAIIIWLLILKYINNDKSFSYRSITQRNRR